MAIPKYQFLDEAGVNTLVENLLTKMDIRIDNIIDANVSRIPASDAGNSVDTIIDESLVDNRLIPTGVPEVEPVIEFPNPLSALTIDCSLQCNDEQVPGTFNWVTSDEEFAEKVIPEIDNSVSPDAPAIVVAPTVWEFTPEDTNTYKPIVGELAIVVVAEPSKIPVSVVVKTPPTKTEYDAGTNFDSTGMELEVTYEDNHTEIKDSGYIITDGENLPVGKTNVNIEYTEGLITLTCTISIAVIDPATIPVIMSMKTPPQLTEYVTGEGFVADGMTLEVTYMDNHTEIKTSGFTITNGNALIDGQNSVTASYTENDVTLTCDIPIKMIKSYNIQCPIDNTQSVNIGTDVQLSAIATMDLFTPTWKSSDINIATVTQDGLVHTVNPGTVFISYERGSVNGTISFIVENWAIIPNSIAVNTPPNITAYLEGENFNSTGLTIEVTYKDGHKVVKDNGFTITDGNNLTMDRTDVNVEYIENNITLSCKIDIQMCNATFTVDSTNKSKVGYTGTFNENLVIPTTFTDTDGTKYKVTSISSSTFRDCTRLKSVNIPNSVTSIDSSAFYGCTRLTSINIPNSVTSISGYAFYGCTGLTSINIPNSVTSIGNRAFSGCTGLTSINIPNSVTSIGSGTFSGCINLTDINIPNSVTSIGSSTFSGCINLTDINIPNSVTSIGGSAFNDVPHITYYGTATGAPWGSKSINDDCSYSADNKLILSIDGKTVLSNNGYLYTGDITIPNSVTSIGNRAFYGCTGLTSLTIPNSVTSIGMYSFAYCSNLTSINIPNSVTSIGNRTFYGCTGLTSLTIPNSVTSIGMYSFAYCSNLTSINIPNSVTSIGSSAFYGCTGLTSINIPNSVTSIGGSAFYVVPHITYYGTATGAPWGSKSINDDCSYSADNKLILSIDGKTVLSNNGYLYTGDITIPNSVTSIGNHAFYGCTGLTSLTIPNSVTSIGMYSFAYCSNLTSINIPNSVTSIGGSAFNDVPHITYYGTATGAPWGALAIN